MAAGALFSGPATASKSGKEKSKSKSLNIKSLSDAITVTNGKAKVSGWARSPAKGEFTVTTQSGESTTYGVREFAEDINQGVKNGSWTVHDRAGELSFDLTERGRQLIRKESSDPIETLGCGNRNKVVGDTIYIGSDSVDDLVMGLAGGSGIFTLAGVIAGAVAGLTLGPIVFAAAGILLGLGATALSLEDDGCGIKIDTNTNSVSPQTCRCICPIP